MLPSVPFSVARWLLSQGGGEGRKTRGRDEDEEEEDKEGTEQWERRGKARYLTDPRGREELVRSGGLGQHPGVSARL